MRAHHQLARLLVACACTATASGALVQAAWHVEHLGGNPAARPAAALAEGDAVIVIPDMATDAESAALCEGAASQAALHRAERLAAGLDDSGLVRVPSRKAAARASITSTPCAPPLSEEADAILQRLLTRAISFADTELQLASSGLFARAAAIHPLYEADELVFSSREPSVNVYTAGGQFLAHKDHQALTILIPLSSPDNSFTGGGTAFWSQDSRGHRVEEPTLELRPAAGTCLMFGGYTTHQGMPVISGERCVLVVSFSRKHEEGLERRAAEAQQSRDIYGDVL